MTIRFNLLLMAGFLFGSSIGVAEAGHQGIKKHSILVWGEGVADTQEWLDTRIKSNGDVVQMHMVTHDPLGMWDGNEWIVDISCSNQSVTEYKYNTVFRIVRVGDKTWYPMSNDSDEDMTEEWKKDKYEFMRAGTNPKLLQFFNKHETIYQAACSTQL